MCGMQTLASATPLSRSHTLPPSEMKSLYGIDHYEAGAMSLSYVTHAMFLQRLAFHHRRRFIRDAP